MADNTSTACPLLGLPAELRNRIWEHAIIRDEAISLAPASDLAPGEALETAAQPALLRVCRQLREETLTMFYARNTFRLHPENVRRCKASRSEKPLLRSLCRHAQTLRRIELQTCQHDNRYRLTMDASLPGGYFFEIVCDDEVYNNTPSGRYCNLGDPRPFNAAWAYLKRAGGWYTGLGSSIRSDQIVKLARLLLA